MNRPAVLPDPNLIETVWHWMKEYMHEHYPETHCSHRKLEDQAIEAWLSIPDSKIRELISSMLERVQAVIDAKGWHTKY